MYLLEETVEAQQMREKVKDLLQSEDCSNYLLAQQLIAGGGKHPEFDRVELHHNVQFELLKVEGLFGDIDMRNIDDVLDLPFVHQLTTCFAFYEILAGYSGTLFHVNYPMFLKKLKRLFEVSKVPLVLLEKSNLYYTEYWDIAKKEPIWRASLCKDDITITFGRVQRGKYVVQTAKRVGKFLSISTKKQMEIREYIAEAKKRRLSALSYLEEAQRVAGGGFAKIQQNKTARIFYQYYLRLSAKCEN